MDMQGVALKGLIGRHVKIAFPAVDLYVSREHIWVKVKSVNAKRKRLVGTLANHPVSCPDLKYGDRVVFGRDEIEEIEEVK